MNKSMKTIHIKKSICFLLSLCLMLMSMPALFAFAEGDPTVAAGTVTGDAGETVQVPVTISADSGVAGYKIVINYDSTKVEAKSCSDGITMPVVNLENAAAGRVIMTWADSNALTAGGTLFTVEFLIKADAPTGEVALDIQKTGDSSTFNGIDGNGKTVQLTNGSINVYVPVTGITLNTADAQNVSSLTLEKGQTTTLSAIVAPDAATNRTVTFSSDNDTIASVDSSTGVITANANGTANITATSADGAKASCQVTVITRTTGITLDKTALTLKRGEKFTLKPTVEPPEATNQKVTFTSDNASVASVDANTGEITAINAGTAAITAATADGGLTAACTVTVTVPVSGISINKDSAAISRLDMIRNATATLTVQLDPEDSTDKTYTITSADTNIAAVDHDTGVVTATGEGHTQITAASNDGGKTAVCDVYVTVPPLVVSGITNNAYTNADVTVTGTSTLQDVSISENGSVLISGKGSASHRFSTSGTHTIKVSNGKEEREIIFTIQKTPPTVDISLSPSAIAVNNHGGIVPTISFGESCVDSSKSILLNGQVYKVGVNGTGPAITQPGKYILTASARDLAGNTTSVTKEFEILWDANAPVINITNGSGGETVEEGDIFTSVQPVVVLSDLSTENSNLENYTYSAELTKYNADGTTTVSSFSKGQEIPELTEPGSYRLYIKAVNPGYTDVVSTKTIDFKIDTDNPTVTIGGIEQGKKYNTAVVPTFEFGDDMAPESVLVSNAAIVLKNGTDTVEYFPGDPITEDGEYTLTAQTTDEVGHDSLSVTVTFTVDRTKPVITISGAVDKFTYKNTDVTVKAAVTTGDKLVVKKSDGTTLAADDGTTDSYTFKATEGSIENFKLLLTASDDAGNISEKTLEFTIDRLPVNIMAAGISEGQITNTAPYISFTTYNGTSELAGTVATIDGTPFTGGVYSQEGNHVCVVKNTYLGTEYTKTVNFTIDRTAPSITGLKVYKNGALQSSALYIKAGDTIKVQATVTDRITDKTGMRDVPGKAALKEVYFTFAGKLVSIAMTNIGGQVFEGTWAVDNTNDSNLDLSVYAKDQAQNIACAAYANKVNIDNIKPVVSLATNPAQPDGRNGIFSSASMSIMLTAGSNETIYYRLNGDDEKMAAGTITLSPAQGSNKLVYRAQDPSGNVSGDKTYVFQYDSILPKDVVLTSSPAGPVNTASVAVSGNVQDESAGNGTKVIVKRVITVNGTAVKETVADASISDKNGNFTIPALQLQEGVNTFELYAQDLAGNVSAHSTAYTIQLDTVPPIISIARGGSDTQYTAVVNEALKAGTTPTAALNGSNSGVTIGDPVGGVYAITIPQLPAGNNTITFTATDAAGNSGTGSLNVSYIPSSISQENLQVSENTLVDIPADAFNQDTRMTVRTTSVTGDTSYKPLAAPLSFEFSDGTHPVQPLVVRMYIGTGLKGVTLIHITDDNKITETNATVVATSSAFDINLPAYPNDTPYYLADTGYLVFKTVNFSTYQPAQDGTPPTIAAATTDFSISRADYDSNAVKLEGTITDQDQNAGIVEVAIDGVPYPDIAGILTIGVPAAISGTNTYSRSYSINLKSVLSNGTHDVRIKAQDTALNSSFMTKTYTVDITPPTLTAAPQRTLTRDQSVTVILNVTESSVISVKKDSEADGSYAAMGTFNGAGSVTLQLTDGVENVFNIRAADAIGNTDVKTVTIRRDSTPPVITVTGVSNGDIRGGAVNISVSATEGLTPTVTMDGASFHGGNYSTPGHHTLSASATDAAGNTTVRTIEFTIDTSVPTLSISGADDGAVYSADQTVHITAENADMITMTQKMDEGEAVEIPTEGLTKDLTISVPENQQHSYTVRATAIKTVDGQIRMATSTVNFIIDKKNPVITMNSIADTQQATVSLTGTIDEVCDIYLGEVKILTAQPTGSFSLANVPLSMGNNTFTITAKDAAGHSSAKTVTVKRVSPPTPGGDSGTPGGGFPGIPSGGTVPGGIVPAVTPSAIFLEPLPRMGTGELPAIEEPVPGKTTASAENDKIGRNGGSVATEDGSIELEIPKGAVNVDKSTFRLVVFEVSPDSPVLSEAQIKSGKIKMISEVVDFGTTAPALLKPVTARFRYDRAAVTSPANLRVYYWNARIAAWVPVEAGATRINAQESEIEADLTHFTRYAVMEVKSSIKFSDVSRQWFETYVDRMALMGITDGSTEKGKRVYKPSSTITRAEFITFLSRTLKLAPSKGYKHVFKDDKSLPSWARQSIVAAYEKGIISEYGDGTIKPNQAITRIEMAVMLVKAMGMKPGGKALTLKDKNLISASDRPYIETIVAKGIMTGKDDGKFHPGDNATRAEVSKVIIEMIEALAKM